MAKGRVGNAFAKGRTTTISLGTRLRSDVDALELSVNDFAEDLDQETIILKDTKTDYWDHGNRIEYLDTTKTRLLREEMRSINTWLATADIQCDPLASADGFVDDQNRILRRYFNNRSFADGGRLFGGFWQPLSQEYRHRYIAINGERVATLDFGQMVVRILYSMARRDAPLGDAYNIPGYTRWRSGVKKVFAAMTFVEGELRTRPRGSSKLLPRHGTVRDVTDAIRRHHAPIAHLLGKLVGHRVFAHESNVLIKVLLALQQHKVVALPIHDAVVVPRRSIGITKAIMEEIAFQHLGVSVPVSIVVDET